MQRRCGHALATCPTFVEPFAGSLAVLLARPHEPKIETVNDADAFLCNVWRSLQADPDAVARWADWPVSEIDLTARHLWLVTEGRKLVNPERLIQDPDYYDAKVAGWWLWGISQWIGSGWCSARPDERESDAGKGVRRQLPHLGDAGRGVHRQRPHLGDAGSDGQGIFKNDTREALIAYMRTLQARLRRVRVCCGDWSRMLGPSPTFKNGLTAVFLDPPYAHEERETGLYAEDHDVAAQVREWAIANGDNPLLRIALCGYEAPGYEMPPSWEAVPWKAHGGYGSQGEGRGRENAKREVVWFNKSCIRPRQTLWGWAEENA